MRRGLWVLGIAAAVLGSCERRPLLPEQHVPRGEEMPQARAPASPEAGARAEPRGVRGAKDFERHVEELRKRLPPGRYTVIVEPPFVVIGDEAPATVRLRARRTVRWAVGKLRQDYFERDPPRILDIWLLKDAESYRRHCLRTLGRPPSTPFGFCSQRDGSLVMNVSTGGGTLVHEIVHPFMAANFPACPAWFNEGLASLYEQSAERDGHIVGLTNWRLRGLQRAIRSGTVPSLKELLHTSESEFYGPRSGIYYAQARYLCYYLQERGLLREFYRRFRAGCASDPTGYRTLKEVLGEDDMRAFQRRWEAFVLALRFP